MSRTLKWLIAICFSLVLSIGLLVGGSYFSLEYIKDHAEYVKKSIEKREALSVELSNMETLRLQLIRDKDIVDLAKNITTPSELYQYQNVVIAALDPLVKQANLEVSSYVFANTDTTKGGKTTTVKPSATQSNTLNSVSVTLELSGDIDYVSFLRFMNSIEQYPTRMQITEFSYAHDTANQASQSGRPGEAPQENKNKNSVTIEIYTR